MMKQEGIYPMYKDKKMVAMIKRDDESKKHLIYITKEANSEEIAELFHGNGFEIKDFISNNQDKK